MAFRQTTIFLPFVPWARTGPVRSPCPLMTINERRRRLQALPKNNSQYGIIEWN
jgi:hypothetical protein